MPSLIGCKTDTINIFMMARNERDSWKWNFDNITESTLQNPKISYVRPVQKWRSDRIQWCMQGHPAHGYPIRAWPFYQGWFWRIRVCLSTRICCIQRHQCWSYRFMAMGFWKLAAQAHLQHRFRQSYPVPFITTIANPKLTITDNIGSADTQHQGRSFCRIIVISLFPVLLPQTMMGLTIISIHSTRGSNWSDFPWVQSLRTSIIWKRMTGRTNGDGKFRGQGLWSGKLMCGYCSM